MNIDINMFRQMLSSLYDNEEEGKFCTCENCRNKVIKNLVKKDDDIIENVINENYTHETDVYESVKDMVLKHFQKNKDKKKYFISISLQEEDGYYGIYSICSNNKLRTKSLSNIRR